MGTKNALKKQIQKTHTRCRRCGRTSFHIQKKVCAACGYPSARNRRYNWCTKMIRRKNRGTGRMRYEKDLPRRFKNGFREQLLERFAQVASATSDMHLAPGKLHEKLLNASSYVCAQTAAPSRKKSATA
ncbi:MAG: hypothetical protein SGPRY_009829 [Prymnesium sp.]